MVGFENRKVVVGDTMAGREASLPLLEGRGLRHNAARHRNLHGDGQQSPPPPMPAQLQPSPEHQASILAVGPNQIPHQVAGVVVKPSEGFYGDHDEGALAGRRHAGERGPGRPRPISGAGSPLNSTCRAFLASIEFSQIRYQEPSLSKVIFP
mgnify:CR=1 FL=1